MLFVNCGVKVDQLPFLNDPYISEILFLKNIKNSNDKIKKISFKNNKITSPFFLYLKLKEVENKNKLFVKFYKKNKLKTELSFEFGEDGKYYDYIIFTDKVGLLKSGKYRYIVFINNKNIFEDSLIIE